ncbi:MAG: IS1595 family transposase [Alphaproteobacteria bacterium]|nr:IS1595 family transposase [Alphaproteobacteria bacterium]MBM3951470.1 IS1595 family transposase [Rhodospirillales bacterium]
MTKPMNVQDFFKRFPDDDTCLEHLFRTRFGQTLDCPKCGKNGKFHRIKRHPAYECAWCGYEIYPMVGTPFAKSHTALQKWYYAIYLFTTSRHGVPAKELQRQLSVTYKTAWRMGHEIRKYMAKVDGDPPLTGHVEVDEAYIGGRVKGGRKMGITGRGANKAVVMGILERGGEVFTKVIPDASRKSLIPPIFQRIKAGTRISTDEWHPYRILGKIGYDHRMINHGQKEYARGDTHVNTIESFWAILKRSIRGTHVHVSPKHLSKYLGEFEYRYNMRKVPALMFDRLLASF